MTLCYLSDTMDIAYLSSFLIEWNHPYRQIENLEMKVDVFDGCIFRRCFVAPSLKRGKMLYNVNNMNGLIISHSDLFPNEDSVSKVADIFVKKQLYYWEGKPFRIFKIWFYDRLKVLPDYLQLIDLSKFQSLICFHKRVEINLNVRKLKFSGEKLDYHLDDNLLPFFQRNSKFYLMPIDIVNIKEGETDLFVIYLSQILNKLTNLSIDALVKRSELIMKLKNYQDNVDVIKNDRKFLKHLSIFLKQFVFVEYEHFSVEIVFILNFVNEKLQSLSKLS